MKKSISIYVVSHKVSRIPKLERIYKKMLVGSFNKKVPDDYISDDTGENISKKNENYCELTGLYWIWKNDKSDIKGLVHYRRFLSKKYFLADPKYYLTEDDIMRDFDDGYNMVLPKKSFYRSTVLKRSLRIAPTREDMNFAKSVIEKKYPDYSSAYDEYIKSHSSYLCNMMICSRKLFDDYSEWLFDILFELERIMPKETYINDPYRKRMFGFVSERLLNVWLIHNADRLKIKEYYKVNTEEKFLRRLIDITKNTIFKIIYRK